MSNIKELDIHMDLLMDTEQGMNILRQKFGMVWPDASDPLQQDHPGEEHLQRAVGTLLSDQRQARVQEE